MNTIAKLPDLQICEKSHPDAPSVLIHPHDQNFETSATLTRTILAYCTSFWLSHLICKILEITIFRENGFEVWYETKHRQV